MKFHVVRLQAKHQNCYYVRGKVIRLCCNILFAATIFFLFLGYKSQKLNEAAKDPFTFNDLNFDIDFYSPDKFFAVVFRYKVLQSNAKSDY